MTNNPPLPSDPQFASEKIKIWKCILTEAKKEAKSEKAKPEAKTEAPKKEKTKQNPVQKK